MKRVVSLIIALALALQASGLALAAEFGRSNDSGHNSRGDHHTLTWLTFRGKITLQTTGVALAAGRTETVDKFGETTTFEYDEASRPEKMTYDTGAYALYTYDGRSRIKAVEHKNSSHTLLRKETNTYDPASRITSRYEGPASGETTTTFGYDDAGQLTAESSSGYSASYTYDANGNRATRTVNSVTETYTVDDSDKLTSVTWSQGGNNYAKEYAYHWSGRPTSIVLKTNGTPTTTRTFTWDKESRITALTDGTTSASYVYNGFTARTSKTVGGTTTSYKRAGASAVSPVVADAVGGTTTNHLPGISSRTGGTSTFSHSGIKNGVLQTNSSQTNTGTKRYDAFGNVLATTGSWATPFSYGGPFGYQTDSEFGYQLLGHRYYDSSTGRFLTRDSIKDGRNWYSYCAGGPIDSVDPFGTKHFAADTPLPAISGTEKSTLLEFAEFCFEFPQNTLGIIAGGTPYAYDPRTNTVFMKDSWLSKLTNNTISLGGFVVSSDKLTPEEMGHELVHSVQSSYLGGMYLPKIIMGYVEGAALAIPRIRSGDDVIKAVHDTNPWEIQADVLSGYESNVRGNWWLSKGSKRNPLGLWEESWR